MAGSLPRPKRKSTQTLTPAVDPDQVLYTDTDRSGDTLDLPLASLCPNPFNKREKRGLPELVATIDQVGLLQNIAHIQAETWIAAYPDTEDQITAPNVILFGEHRWLAIQELGWETIPSVLSDDKVHDARLITLIENLRRAQLSPLEEAEHYQALRESGLSYEQIAEKIGEEAAGAVSKGTIWKRIRLLELAPELQQAVRQGMLKVSAAEKAMRLDSRDQMGYLELVRDGALPAEAHAEILARQRQVANAPDDDEPSDEREPVSTGNEASPKAEATDVVSSGNGASAPPSPRDQKQAKSSRTKGDADQRAAAAARNESCRSLLKGIDVTDHVNHDLILDVLAAAVLAPQQQSAAQRRAFTWLRDVGREHLEADDAGDYFTSVQRSGDPALQRLAAFATALAAAELRTAARRQSWGSREYNYLRALQEHAEYEPETEWEKKQLASASAGGSR